MSHTLCLLLAMISGTPSTETLTVLPTHLGTIAPRDMMRSHWMRLSIAALDRHDAEYEQLKTPEQLTAHQEKMRQYFLAQIGGFPNRTPLHAKIIGRRECDGYTLEKVLFESQPQHYVTAVLYLPKGRPPFPGVLVPCGHSANGKGAETYQRVSILLARSGMVALCYDPIDQGERAQLLDANRKPLSPTTGGHSLLGVGSMLLGRNTATYRIWDGMRAIDYLQSRPEVDPKRIGCTGNSGGGTLTSYLMALDERIQAAAPSCYLTSLRRLLETVGPQDAEQNICGQVAYSMDHSDYVLTRSPRPTLMCCATHDFFDIGGAWDTFRKAKRFYARQGYAERVDLIEADEKHGFTPPLRQAAVRWMRRWLLNNDQPVWDTNPPVLKDAEIQCTPDGQVMLLAGARSAYDLNADLADRLTRERKRLWSASDKSPALAAVRHTTGIRRLAELPTPKVEHVGTLARDGYRIEKYIFQTDSDVWLPALLLVPAAPRGAAYLYVHQDGKQADAAPGGPMEQLAREGHTVLAVDLGGLGETGPDAQRKAHKYLGANWLDLYRPYLLGTSYVAEWAEEMLIVARWLAAQPGVGQPAQIHLLSVGRTGPAALHALALEPQQFAAGTLRHSLASWDQVVRTPLAVNQLINCVHGALRVYDLPDLAASLPRGKLTLTEPLDATEQASATAK